MGYLRPARSGEGYLRMWYTPTPIGQQKEYLLRDGRYSSCVHAGGLLSTKDLDDYDDLDLVDLPLFVGYVGSPKALMDSESVRGRWTRRQSCTGVRNGPLAPRWVWWRLTKPNAAVQVQPYKTLTSDVSSSQFFSPVNTLFLSYLKNTSALGWLRHHY